MPDSQPPPEPEMQSPDTGTAQYAGAFFPHSERLLISGGVFTSNIINITQGTPPLPLDFRMIPMGDIYLRHRVGIVTRWTGRNCARRLYSARIEGKQTDMTVAMYQGDNAEQEWREDISRYLSLRHPNFLQLYGVASSAGIHAIILHDELIPAEDFKRLYEHLHSLMVHVIARSIVELTVRMINLLISQSLTPSQEAKDYFDSVFHKDLYHQHPHQWIDRSNGRLCIDVMSDRLLDDNSPSSQYPRSMAPGIDSAMLLNEYHRLFPPLTPEQYHWISHDIANTSSPYVDGPVPPIHLASILWSSEGLKAIRVGDATSPVIIPTNPVINYERWGIESWGIESSLMKSMANGWERQVVMTDTTASTDPCFMSISLKVKFERPESWLSQANRIFERLNVTCNKGNYALVDALEFTVIVEGRARGDVRGYLFVCLPEDFRLPGTSSFRWHDCPAYWSFDPTGAERLSTEAAIHLGFPPIQFRTRVKLKSWDDTVYGRTERIPQKSGIQPRQPGYVSDGEYSTADDEDLGDSLIQALHENTFQGLPSSKLRLFSSLPYPTCTTEYEFSLIKDEDSRENIPQGSVRGDFRAKYVDFKPAGWSESCGRISTPQSEILPTPAELVERMVTRYAAHGEIRYNILDSVTDAPSELRQSYLQLGAGRGKGRRGGGCGERVASPVASLELASTADRQAADVEPRCIRMLTQARHGMRDETWDKGGDQEGEGQHTAPMPPNAARVRFGSEPKMSLNEYSKVLLIKEREGKRRRRERCGLKEEKKRISSAEGGVRRLARSRSGTHVSRHPAHPLVLGCEKMGGCNIARR
ncbi:hypothetical protein B0H11DRAFT_2204353 [Mycena galericulata]|nr:hypothetical protein B0H11DRAFT_2204353 [Mycena galericulata]